MEKEYGTAFINSDIEYGPGVGLIHSIPAITVVAIDIKNRNTLISGECFFTINF